MPIRNNGGFTEAQIDTDIENDERIEDLRLNAPAIAAKAFHVYVLLTLRSWRQGKRLALRKAWPELWYPRTLLPDIEAALIEAGLLEVNGTISEQTWEHWYGKADAFYTAKVNAGSKGGRTTQEANRAARAAKADLDLPMDLTPEQQERAEVAARVLREQMNGLADGKTMDKK